MRKWKKGLVLAVVVGLGLWGGALRSSAADDGDAMSLATAPSGLDQLDKIFTVPSVFSNGSTNKAKISDVTNAAAPNTQAVELVNAKNQVAGVWSNDANRFNLNEDTTLKAWVYLGSQSSASKAGAGMTFVLQNDANGVSAAAQVNPSKILAETMATWGVDSDNKQQDPQVIAGTAIQNSWALEFDTYAHKETSYGNAGNGLSFDKGIKTQHMATGYPGNAATYASQSVKSWDLTGVLLGTRYYFSQNHTNLVDGLALGNGKWHHLVLDWHAASRTMTYTFDDVNPDGSENTAGFTKSEVIDTSQFHSADGLVRWGFMAATGSNSSSNMVVIESAPNMVKAAASVKVTDTTKNRVVNAGDKVKAKHGLQYDYTVNYQGGSQDWNNVKADLKLPENVTFKTAAIQYADGSKQILTAPEAGAKEVSYQLGKALYATNATATITLTGTADDVKINSNTTTTTSTFKNKTFSTTADSPDYVITVDQPISLYIMKSNYPVNKGEDVKVSGLVIAEDSEQLKNSSITVHPTLNGEKLASFQMSDDDESGYYALTIKADQLKVGKNTLTLWAADMDDNESPEASATITVSGGELGFKSVAATSRFQPITLDGKAQETGRQDDWQVVVSDERGKGSNWQLQAKVGDFTDAAGKKLPGQLLFKQAGETTVLNDQGTVIDQHETTSDTDEYDVTKDWSDQTGLFYKSNAAATPGNYGGKITWTLTNAPS
ncbi:cell surface protein [Lactiplantibacillus plajomi]|uniref:Cell surface protein n=1 Tax=Lactiplantibacillus plajomi TaxID=1457217 RepID=A0ABV6KA23_9LACO|nr:cell surface protein [Lactiplantibacillus plajomi]